MNNTTTTPTESYYILPRADSYTVVSFISISTFTCLLIFFIIFDLSFFTTTSTSSTSTSQKPRNLVPTYTLLTTTTTTLLASAFCILLLFNHNQTAVRIASATGLVLTTTTTSITNTLLLYFALPLITIHQKPQAYFQLKTQRLLLYTIIASILLFQLPYLIVAPAAATLYKDGHWTHAVKILERISVTTYCLREIAILGVYTWSVIRYLRPVIYHHHHHHHSLYHYQLSPTHQKEGGRGTQLLYTLLMAGCISLILNIANIVTVYIVHNAAAMAFFPFVASTKVLIEILVLRKLIGFLNTHTSSSYHQRSVYSISNESRRSSTQPLMTTTAGSTATMSGGLITVETKDTSSEQEHSPGAPRGQWYRSRTGSVDTIISVVDVAEPPLAHSAEHLVQEIPDLEGAAAISRRTSVV
ncbi:hypothetical protein AbraIFM66951_009935 [Aspergillus brasiliensis]|uniref:Uncharacterized protein n=1 Tax=Aspergillus brasiliensis TaxID=319629 RepID=A0A9W5Z018_9EURO|nr:hypothetical protein AbraCBS73388_001709 [Aspergillus brasiliensis]GKZ46780.1 hypothetical protein AbraIFM66951_009935 [Aspergillus brasiliensis]